jgi:hypothetical protein
VGRKSYVLAYMFVTSPTSHVEISPLKLPAPLNTAPQQHKKSPRIKMGWKKKRREHCSKIELVLPQKEEGEIEAAKKRPDLGEGEEECTYLIACPSLSRPARRRDHH